MNWFKYRLPGEHESIGGASERLVEGMAEGFVIAPFMNPADHIITIPADSDWDGTLPPVKLKQVASKSFASKKDLSTVLPTSTPKESHHHEVEAIKEMLTQRGGGKTVAARVIRLDGAIDLDASFDALCVEYPDAFIYMFHTERTGTWIGATPELLLHRMGSTLFTMALAGTRPSGAQEEWDVKNIEEQKMVTDFIVSELTPYCSSVNLGKTFTKEAGPVEHICTPMTATIVSFNDPVSILGALSPTPAVCGSDREASMQIIQEYEDFDRGMYGGFCGPSYAAGDFSFFVTLRCAQCSDDAVALYVGGGITPLSDPDSEWNETEMKASTLLKNIKFKQL